MLYLIFRATGLNHTTTIITNFFVFQPIKQKVKFKTFADKSSVIKRLG